MNQKEINVILEELNSYCRKYEIQTLIYISIIKEIYDVAKDIISQSAKFGAVKRTLKSELKINKKSL